MKRTIVMIAAAAMMVACGSKTQTFSAADGSVTATVKGDTWHITGADGREVVENYDSMRVVQVSEDGHPMTVCYYCSDGQRWLQYYSDMTQRSEGRVVDGRREGRWVFYHPDGSVQSECTFAGGLEEGPYKVFREGGIPYYIGQYTAGRRSGTWEIYDDQGNLVGTKEYD